MWLERAVALRLAICRLFKSAVEELRPSVAALAVLNTELSLARKHQELVQVGGRFQWTWNDPGSTLDSILWRVSQSAADLPDVCASAGAQTAAGCSWTPAATTAATGAT